MPNAVALLRTRPETVVEDYGRLMRLVKYDQVLPRDQDLILKLNLSWTKYFPACSSQPWQVDGVLTTLVDDGYDRRARSSPSRTRPWSPIPIEGCRNNKWRAGAATATACRSSRSRTSSGSVVSRSQSPLLKLNRDLPRGHRDPDDVRREERPARCPRSRRTDIRRTTGAIKNAFGGLLKEVRHYAHEFIHEVMVDLMYMQRELHPAVFAVMDGTVMGDGAGPRTMVPRVGNLILASAGSGGHRRHRREDHGLRSALDSVPRACVTSAGLGVADPREIEIVGDPDAADARHGVQDLAQPRDLGRSADPARAAAAAQAAAPALAARGVGALRVERLPRSALVPDRRPRAHPRLSPPPPWGRLFERY